MSTKIVLTRKNVEITIEDDGTKNYIMSQVIYPTDDVGLPRANAIVLMTGAEILAFIQGFLQQ